MVPSFNGAFIQWCEVKHKNYEAFAFISLLQPFTYVSQSPNKKFMSYSCCTGETQGDGEAKLRRTSRLPHDRLPPCQ